MSTIGFRASASAEPLRNAHRNATGRTAALGSELTSQRLRGKVLKGRLEPFRERQLLRRATNVAKWRNHDFQWIAGKVCFQEAAKPISTAETGRKAAT